MHHLATESVSLEAPRPAPVEWRVYAVTAGSFLAAAVPTVYFSLSMRGSMPMPGGWSMSMVWMPMGGWTVATLMFALMWFSMMVAMMLPSTLPILLLYRRVMTFRGQARTGRLAAVLAAGYFLAWTGFGMGAYAAGVLLTQSSMRWNGISRAVPVLAGASLVAAGLYQLTPWKQACLRHCRDPLLLLADHSAGGWRNALRLGLHHGVYCVACCWALMLVQLVIGVMDLALMAAIGLVIAMEKLLPGGARLARLAGLLILAAGAAQLVRLFLS